LEDTPTRGRAPRSGLHRSGVDRRPGSPRDARRPDLGTGRVATPAAAVRRPGAVLRNRLETTNGQLAERLGLARHGAKTFWGRLPRTAATILAHTLQLLDLV